MNIKYTPKDKQKVLDAFYRTKLYKNEETIDNRSEVIAKRFKMPLRSVNKIIDVDLENKKLKL